MGILFFLFECNTLQLQYMWKSVYIYFIMPICTKIRTCFPNSVITKGWSTIHSVLLMITIDPAEIQNLLTVSKAVSDENWQPNQLLTVSEDNALLFGP